jgi:hypothetical protein
MSWLAQSLMTAQPVAALTSSPTPAQAYPCDGSLLNFDGPSQGWVAEANSPAYAKVNTDVLYPLDAPEGGKSMSLHLDLEGDLKDKNDWAQFKIDLDRVRPGCAQGLSLDTTWWEPGSVLSLWVWAPSGTRGHSDYANGLHLYAVDDEDRKYYGTWQTFQENTWFEVTLKLGGQTPACSDPDPEFDFSRIRTLGLNIALNKDVPTPIHDSVLISPLRIKSGFYSPPASDHLYSFEDATKEEFPAWRIVTDKVWEAEAFTDSRTLVGALVIDADFHEDDAPHRKGVMDLIFAPDLHLRDPYPLQEFISLDIKFDPPPDFTQAPCPFSLKLWAFDSGRKVQFDSINQDVGSGEWTRVAFRLEALLPSTGGANPGDRLDPSRIGKIGFQIYDGTDGYDYQGRIWIDNIAIGGAVGFEEPEEPPDLSFVTTDGPHFMLDGNRFRFVGANAEYLPFKSDLVVEDVLDRAEALGIRVLRTWGFGEGCEDYSLAGCEELSPYFQPRAGVYNESAFEHFDRIVYEAGRRNIRLIVPLANNWHEYGGIPRYVCWKTHARHPSECNVRLMTEEDHDLFYTDPGIRKQYQDYVEHFVTHRNTITGIKYAEDPTIMAWELINEPRSKSDPSGEHLHEWIVEMSKHLADHAPDQLIGTGEEGWYILPQKQADDFQDWQEFDKNYWHYGVNWRDASCTDDWGSNGTDFVSNHSTTPQTVEWQDWAGRESSAPISSARRDGVPEVDFTGIHLYLSPAETSLSRAPYCHYYGLDSLCSSSYDTTENGEVKDPVHQAREWIKQHAETAHGELNKPFILEEFNFPVPPQDPLEASVNPDGNLFQVTRDERARLFRQYLDFSYDLDVDAVMFWNLGYDGFMQQPWNEIEVLKNWEADFGGYLSGDTSDGIQLYYYSNEKNSMELSNPKVDWLRAEGNQVMVDLFNDGDAQEVVVEVQLAGDIIPRSKTIQIQPGENKFSLDELFAPVNKLQSATACPLPKQEPPLVTRITITIQKFTSGGSALFNFYTIFNNKYVIFPEDPVEDVIRTATHRWAQGFEPVPPKVMISRTVTCGEDIHAALIDEPLPILFDLRGSLEHADGYYYRYSIAAPRGQYELNFGSTGRVRSGRISVIANAVGKYEVKIAPEGESLDSDSADSCSFEVINAAPVLNIVEVQMDGREFRSPHYVLNPGLKPMRMERSIKFWITGQDDTSRRLKIGCQLLRENKIVDQELFPCQTQWIETTDLSMGFAYPIQGHLPPGHYEFQLWLEDEELEMSEISALNIVIPDPSSFYVFLALGIILAVVVFFGRSRILSIFSRLFPRKVHQQDPEEDHE